MKRLFTILAISGLLFLGSVQNSYAVTPAIQTEQAATEAADGDKPFHQILKEKFIEGTPIFMSFVLITLILGLAIAIERSFI